MNRREAVRLISAESESDRSGIRLTFTRKGVEVFGWYDHYCGIGDEQLITWAEIESIREQVNEKTHNAQSKARTEEGR